MTLSHFLTIFSSRQKLCLTIVAAVLLLSLASYRLQEQTYSVSMLLSVTRSTSEATPDYKFDHFYRLQADERFADTVVRYVKSEEGKRETVARADLNSSEATHFLRTALSASRLSSQIISVNLKTTSVRMGEKLVAALPEAVNGYTTDLNREARAENWFLVLGSDPVVSDARFTWRIALVVGFLTGIFIAFWAALGDHFLTGERRDSH